MFKNATFTLKCHSEALFRYSQKGQYCELTTYFLNFVLYFLFLLL